MLEPLFGFHELRRFLVDSLDQAMVTHGYIIDYEPDNDEYVDVCMTQLYAELGKGRQPHLLRTLVEYSAEGEARTDTGTIFSVSTIRAAKVELMEICDKISATHVKALFPGRGLHD